LVASRLETVATAVRAAARAASNSVGQVTLSGGAVPRANVDVGALRENIFAHVAAPYGTVATADVSAMGNAGAAMRAAVRAMFNLLARVALRGGAFQTAALCFGALVQAASAMYAAAHTSSRASWCRSRKSPAGRPASAQKYAVSASAGVYGAKWNGWKWQYWGVAVVHRAVHPPAQICYFFHYSDVVHHRLCSSALTSRLC